MSSKKPNQPNAALSRWNELDAGLAPETGKRVFYQLTDLEGGNIIGPDDAQPSRKCLAFIDAEYRQGTRGVTGTLTVSLSIFRPLHKGGFFQKEGVEFQSGRAPGTCDTIQPEDLAS